MDVLLRVSLLCESQHIVGKTGNIMWAQKIFENRSFCNSKKAGKQAVCFAFRRLWRIVRSLQLKEFRNSSWRVPPGLFLACFIHTTGGCGTEMSKDILKDIVSKVWYHDLHGLVCHYIKPSKGSSKHTITILLRWPQCAPAEILKWSECDVHIKHSS